MACFKNELENQEKFAEENGRQDKKKIKELEAKCRELNHERKINLSLLDQNENSFERRSTISLLSDDKLRVSVAELKAERLKVKELERALSERLAGDQE